jgi:peptide/nickel transport system substrate-binding protein
MNRIFAAVLLACLWSGPAFSAYVEPDTLQEKVSKGELPAIEKRLPDKPLTVDMAARGKAEGQYGGSLRMLIGGPKDIRFMSIFGYARLVGFNEKLQLEPDILESFEVSQGRVFTFHLRAGLKWSDGEPVTPEDFRYALEDVQLNEDLTNGVISTFLLVNGKPPKFEILDPLTVRYTWEGPNPDFLPRIAAPQALVMVMPSHYLKQFHKKYQDEAKLEELMKQNKAKKWTRLHIDKSQSYRPSNPELPMLDPWIPRTKPPAEQFVFERNPYYYKVDKNGRQLPYIDRFVLNVSSSSLIPAKTGAGEADLQATAISFNDYTFLKEAEKAHPIKVRLWQRIQGSRIALYPNLNYEDPVWRKLLQDVRLRRALSLAIDRREINMAVFFGLGRESSNTMLQESPLYNPENSVAWSKRDVSTANALLDEIGLDKRDSDGIRLLPDGRRAEIILESSGEDTVETDVLELVKDHWADVGISLLVRSTQTDVFRSRIIGGQTMFSIWPGLDNGIATPDMNPEALAPTNHDQLEWPQWGINFESSGEKGAPPDLPEAVELLNLYKQWRSSTDTAARADIWKKMLALYADQVFTIGIVNATLQPIVTAANLKNIPEKGLFGFDPTAYLGVYGADTFWVDKGQ